MRVGCVEIQGAAGLSPMAGSTDLAFRRLCRELGAAYTVTEMVSAKALCYGDRKTGAILRLEAGEHPSAVQVFGAEPETVAEGAALALERSGADVLDLNMGCPMPKIVNNGEGSALMRDLPRAAAIIRAAADAVRVPVTVKFRLGWDGEHLNCVDFAKMAEDSGAAALCVHGRTREQLYAGRADWDAIARVKAASGIPVMANGDVFSASDAVKIREVTGADFIMVGRGALGNPWIFREINAALSGREIPPPPPLSERLATALRQAELTIEYKGEHIALLEARRYVAQYMKGERGMAAYRARVSNIKTLSELKTLIDEVCEGRKEDG